ncbi:gamma-carboxymuconolactone decarboxylase subunit -like protein [Candidatus Methanomethylophilus sp. 1R26]|uniref:carboxymuconolactone decarboxylase family protein n=1 Tax=Candidatus Methanomethylophilus sp. 1R26 TaxID=1769296 RepID=UPI00073699E0|nr:carboxymuconolactone decarboxylase family protein [Candidatus Methanomethylophilus sp. 1R26]KUE74455.1 gamma-carboxymuconolactone decarboxylase subunit -like protein [Candidatus Methanomethylophilus sp. 1R26]TQS81047.1 MAG: gamma-carboxymuconolactone decarboxylase subunit -like protein [Methanomethylophilus alvi]
MENEEKLRQRADEILNAIESMRGKVPVVNRVLSERPDLFVPNAELSMKLFEGEGSLDKKTRELVALAAAAALGGQYCMKEHIRNAAALGATKDEILEALEIAGYMCMTRSQSYAFRVFADAYGMDVE